jgi:hypothetical protein
MSIQKSDSDRFIPTQMHPIIEIVKNSKNEIRGYVCPTCGHLATEECELLGMTCPKCLQKWLEKNDVQQMVAIKDLKEERDSALDPTIKVPIDKHPYDETTVIIPKKRKLTESDCNIPGL